MSNETTRQPMDENSSLEELEQKYGSVIRLIEEKRQEVKIKQRRQSKKIYDQQRKKTTFALNSRFSSSEEVAALKALIQKARSCASSSNTSLATELARFGDFCLSSVVTSMDELKAVENLLEKAQKVASANGGDLIDEIGFIIKLLPQGRRRTPYPSKSAQNAQTNQPTSDEATEPQHESSSDLAQDH